MTDLAFIALDSATVARLQVGGTDANGQRPERQVSDGDGNPCRHCLQNIEAGAAMLVLAHRPFPTPQPYAELGPIFLHAEACPRHVATAELPAVLRDGPDWIVRGYGRDDRIVYGSGGVVPTAAVTARAGDLLAREEIAYLHVRSARNNCYQCRIERA